MRILPAAEVPTDMQGVWCRQSRLAGVVRFITLNELGMHVRVAEPTERQRPEWRELTADEVGELARELIRTHGAYTEATTLLVRADRVAYADAKERVHQIEAEARGD